MKKLTSYFKTLLVMAALVGGVNSAWAYTPALTEDYEVAGYKLKAYYNIATENLNDMCPPYAANALTYRGSGYGLFNYGSGNRGADVTISVANGDLLLAEFKDSQARSVTINSISNCTKNDIVTSGDILAYDVTADATSLNINVGRGGCIIAFLVMEKDASASTAEFTINYLLNGAGDPVKTTSGEIAVGSVVNTDASFFVDDVKYIRANGEAESLTIASGENVLNVNVRLAATYNYSLVSNLGATIATGTGLEGENVSVGYPRYQFVDSKFYEADVTNKEYRKTVTLSEDNVSVTVDYTQKDNNVVFYQEAEAMEGMTVSTANNIPVRASGAVAAVSSEDIAITTIPAGKYIIHAGIFTSKSNFKDAEENPYSINFGVGSETFKAAFTAVNLNEVASAEYDLSESTAISYLGTTSWADAQFDYIWIEKTGVHIASMSIVGDFSENGWEPAQGIAMTQNAETPAIWTAVVEDYEITSDKLNYEYKAVANGNWSDYVLPSGDNQNYNFDYDGAGAGTYKLTFTVNTTDNSVELAIEKQGEEQPEVTYTVAGSDETMFGSAWDPTATANDLTKNEDGTYSITYEGVALTGNVEYKVVKNHAWDEAWPSSNRIIGINMPGTYDVILAMSGKRWLSIRRLPMLATLPIAHPTPSTSLALAYRLTLPRRMKM